MYEPIRVLQIVGDVVGGGVETVIMNYHQHIDRSRVQFDYIVHKGALPSYIEKAKLLGGKVFEVTSYQKNVFKYVYEVYRIIRDGHYTIVHSNMNSISGFPLLAAFMAGVRVRILHNHTTDSKEEGFRTFLKRFLRPFARLFANRYWACSQKAAEWMYGSDAVNNKRITIINNAIDYKKFAFNLKTREKLRAEFGLQDCFVIGHVGRFVTVKNHEFLIDLFNEVCKEKHNAKLLLVGDGPLKRHIEQKVEKLNLSDKVVFLGVRDDVADLYNAMDVFVFPSFYEGLGMVAIEAQVNGLPVLCSENISKEILISKAVSFLSIKHGANLWCENILNIFAQGRLHTVDYLVDNGFDVKVEAKKLEECYEAI